ncbi:hypothetical protein ACOMICROBIO_LKFPLAJE_00328 [Vibrio sp. B1FIG11]|nr:hypothetical protein ACOMICROBIO_LKFPLAJE_00328 [Vibrio sp. B1FIG11]
MTFLGGAGVGQYSQHESFLFRSEGEDRESHNSF